MTFERLGTMYRLAKFGLAVARLAPDGKRTLGDLIEEQAAARPDHPFVLFEDRRTTYAEYNAAANRVAHWALDAGLASGDKVALLMQNRPEFLEVWAGLAKVGITTALINTNLTHRALEHALSSSGVRDVIVGSECLPSYGTLGTGEWQAWVLDDPGAAGATAGQEQIEDLDAALAHAPDTNPDRAVRSGVRTGDDLFYIYTSGTTGLPKAARFSHLKFFSAAAPGLVGGFTPDDTMYCALPLYHTAGGVMAAGAALCSGGTLALRRRFSASEFWNDIARYDATAFQYIGEFCRYLLNQMPQEAEKTHRLRFCIGNGLRPDIWEEFRDRFRLPRIVEFYGATEGNIAMLNLDGKVGSVGRIPLRVLMDARLIRYDLEADEPVRDEQGHCIECDVDEPGELIGKLPKSAGESRGRFEGYTSKEATEKKILRDAFQEGDAFFRTGDLLRRDAGGYFYFVDRIGDTFRWKGENVSTQEVAEAVGVFPGVEMCNVYGVEIDGADGRAGMAAMVFPDGGAFDGEAFYRFVADALPAYAAPVFVRLQPEAEVTGTFKLRKVDLQREGYDPATVKDPLFLRDDAARAYVALTPERLTDLAAGRLRV